MVQDNNNGWKENGIYQFLVYADNVNILRGRVYTVKEYKETLLVGGTYFGLELNADKTWYMAISGYRDAGRRHNKSIKNFERMEENKYWGTT
jgi:hypothetical protein